MRQNPLLAAYRSPKAKLRDSILDLAIYLVYGVTIFYVFHLVTLI